MSTFDADPSQFPTSYRPLRLDTLVRLRWLAIAGQTIALLTVAAGLQYPLPVMPCLGLIGLSVLLNIGLITRYGTGHRVSNGLGVTQLAFDCLQLGGLLWLTGGLHNPFALLLIAPVSISATILPQRETLLVGGLAALIATALGPFHLPLPWDALSPITHSPIYLVGTWLALLCGIAFISVYTMRVAREARQLSDALAATELALSRQQQLSALDGLAAAAAHELGTPLSTIALAAKEMLVDIKGELLLEDVQLIIEQTARCRTILSKLRGLDKDEGSPFTEVPITDLIQELAQPYGHFGKDIQIKVAPSSGREPIVERKVGLLYGLGNLIENAVQFSRTKVTLSTSWNHDQVNVIITDDGPGIAPELLARLGEPYLTTRPLNISIPNGSSTEGTASGGLGLGVFIATTLLERGGATIKFSNTHAEGHARVQLAWPRTLIEVPGPSGL